MTSPFIDLSSDSAFWPQRFTLGEWNTRASVRTSEHRYLLASDIEKQLETRYWFPPALLPYLNHSSIKTAGRTLVHRLSANHLVHFLDYTTLLEHRIVNRSVETIVHNDLGISIPKRMKTAALQLYTDEGYHALFSNNLAEQIADFYGMTDRPVMPQRIIRLNALIDGTPDRNKALAWFLVGFVSETIIAKELLDVCRHTLVCCVQEMLRDHLADEALHSRYFSEAFHYLWVHLSCEQSTFAAKLLLEILHIFFETDERWLGESLRSACLEEATVAEILSDMTSDNAHLLRVRSGAGVTLQALKKAGLFDLPANRQIFSKAGLFDEQ